MRLPQPAKDCRRRGSPIRFADPGDPPTLIAAQSSVEWGERGAVTGMNAFARSAGSAVGVAVFGAISNAIIARGAGPDDPSTIVHASVGVFVAVAATALLTLLAASFMPRDSAESYSG